MRSVVYSERNMRWRGEDRRWWLRSPCFTRNYSVTWVVGPRCVGVSPGEVRGTRPVRDPGGKAEARGGERDGEVSLYVCSVVVK